MCGVPRSTLIDKISGRTSIYAKLGARPVFTEEEEKKLVESILVKRGMGQPMARKHVREEVKQMLDGEGRKSPFKNNLPGKKW